MKEPELIILGQAEVYAPEYSGKKDILLSGERILALADKIEACKLGPFDIEYRDAKGHIVIPGLIDAHVHIAGAGGEGGPSTRTPEMQLSQMLAGGITTVIGCLGTDGITRTPESVLMKVKSLRAEGASAWMYTGSYQVPTPTITGSISRDLALIDEIIGAGEIALSDHRSSCPTTPELIRLVEEARVGGMLGGKAGIVNIHMGDAKNPFHPIEEAVKHSELKYRQFFPTHCNRNHYIFDDAKKYGREGYIDVTASSYPYFAEFEIKPSSAIAAFLNAGVPPEHITMTSDGNGSLPHFNEKGELLQLEMGQPKSIYDEWVDMVKIEKLPMETALRTITSNVASILKLSAKGRIRPGFDADLVVVDKDLVIKDVIMRGKRVVKDGVILKKGTYE